MQDDEQNRDMDRHVNRPNVDTTNTTFSISDTSHEHALPFSKWWAILAGAAVGVGLRVIFRRSAMGIFETMSGVFIFLVPMAVGAITVYLAERQKRRSWGYYIWAPASANLAFVIGTMLILIEGMICAILIVPLFVIFGALGGLIMGTICRVFNWPTQAVYSFVLLPVILGAIPNNHMPTNRIGVIQRSVIIDASPSTIWWQIHNARDIQPDEVKRGWMYRIGVPLPESGMTEQTPEGLVRKIRMGKGVHFEQVVTDWQENQFVKWKYRFTKDSFPSGALDDHVRIGGRYFDLIDTSYRLIPINDHSTRVSIVMSYRVSTDFNWYADPIARLLIGNFEEVILDFYRNRATRNTTLITNG
ncbi:MAG: SRPBCC domain-containing protein [Steroidobacter sp.]